jgi:hypothetical protein
MPALDNHQVADRHFVVGTRDLTPQSIRDQQNRAIMLVEEAFQRSILDASSKLPLLIAGGGFAGVTALLHAHHLKIPTLLIEETSGLLSLQYACSSRGICPTQYLFPAHYYGDNSFLISGQQPLNNAYPHDWQRNSIDQICVHHHRLLRQNGISEIGGPLSPTWNGSIGYLLNNTATVNQPRVNGQQWIGVSYSNSSQQLGLPDQVQMILETPGFGVETCAPEHNPYPVPCKRFWEHDRLGEPNLGLSTPPKEAVAVVVGGGDGALQDLLRLLFQPNKDGLFYSIELLTRTGLQQQPQFMQRLADLQQQVDIKSLWLTENDTQSFFESIHHWINRWFDELFQDANLRNSVNQAIMKALRPDNERPRKIVFVHPHRAFSQCYLLNRMLVMLTLRVLKDNNLLSVPSLKVNATKKTILEYRPGAYAVAVLPRYATLYDGINPDDRPSVLNAGYGQPHDVYLSPQREPFTSSQDVLQWCQDSTRVHDIVTADMVIFRSGTLPSRTQSPLPPAGRRQLVPHFVGHDFHLDRI